MLATYDYRSGVGAHWTFLPDPGRKVQKDLDTAEYTDPEHDLMIPHVIVLEPGLVSGVSGARVNGTIEMIPSRTLPGECV